MDIKRAKQEIIDAVKAYLIRDEDGEYLIPSIRQRPILLMGPPGIGKTQIMEQIARECKIGLVAYTITHHTRQSAVGLPFIREKNFGGKTFSVTEYTMSEIIASVYEKMEQILLDMETNKQEMECAFKVLHLLMDNSQVSKQLRELFREKKDNELPLYQMLQKLIQEELGEGSGISQEDTLYLVMNTMSKLVCYAMYLNYDGVMSVYGTKKIRERICRAICQEVENVERVEGSADKNID